jgi:hypothetical protein
MSDENNVSRRNALKGLALGLGAAGSLPILNNHGLAQQAHVHDAHATEAQSPATAKKPEPPKFFSASQMALISAISELIIPTDDHSPGALAAEVPAFTDLMISESPAEAKKLWTDGLAAVDALSQSRYQAAFTGATPAQQTALLTEISKNEASPKSIEERFFRAIKNMTIDGYYTSKVGIQQELQYKGNTYLKEFKGCTHPEHING